MRRKRFVEHSWHTLTFRNVPSPLHGTSHKTRSKVPSPRIRTSSSPLCQVTTRDGESLRCWP